MYVGTRVMEKKEKRKRTIRLHFEIIKSCAGDVHCSLLLTPVLNFKERERSPDLALF